MPSMGGYSVIRVDGPKRLAAVEVKRLDRPGVDGVDYMDMGIKGRPYTVTSLLDLTSTAALNQAMATFSGMQGNLITVVDNAERTFLNQMVLGVQHEHRKLGAAIGGVSGGEWLLTTTWELEATGV